MSTIPVFPMRHTSLGVQTYLYKTRRHTHANTTMAVLKSKVNNAAHRLKNITITTTATTTSSSTAEFLEAVMMVVEMTTINHSITTAIRTYIWQS